MSCRIFPRNVQLGIFYMPRVFIWLLSGQSKSSLVHYLRGRKFNERNYECSNVVFCMYRRKYIPCCRWGRNLYRV